MSYLKKLEKDVENRLRYEKEEEQLKQSMVDLNSLYVIHDGLMLEDLLKFIEKWKNKKI